MIKFTFKLFEKKFLIQKLNSLINFTNNFCFKKQNDFLKKDLNLTKKLPLIQIINLNKTFKSRRIKNEENHKVKLLKKIITFFQNPKKEFIHNLNMEIYHNDRIAIIGGNGAGKTTLSEIICGYKSPTSGQIIYNYDYENHPCERISIQFQNNSFNNNFYVTDVLNMAKIISSEVEDENLYKILKIKHILNKKIKNLSGGESQRLSLYISLVCKPKLLILDEYSNNLDLKSKQDIFSYLKNYFTNHEIALILVSHDPEQIWEFSKRIIFLKKGKIIEEIENLHQRFSSVEQLSNYIITKI